MFLSPRFSLFTTLPPLSSPLLHHNAPRLALRRRRRGVGSTGDARAAAAADGSGAEPNGGEVSGGDADMVQVGW